LLCLSKPLRLLTSTFSPNAVIADAREDVTTYVRTRSLRPTPMLAAAFSSSTTSAANRPVGELAKNPHDRVRNFRNDMYLVSEALRLMQKSHKPEISAGDTAILTNYKKHIDKRHHVHPAG